MKAKTILIKTLGWIGLLLFISCTPPESECVCNYESYYRTIENGVVTQDWYLVYVTPCECDDIDSVRSMPIIEGNVITENKILKVCY